MKKLSVKSLVLLSLLGAWAIAFRMIEIPLLPAAPFLKMDMSDFVVLIGLLTHGPLGLISVAGIRDVVWYLYTGGDMGVPIGEIMSLSASIVMFLPMYIAIKRGWSIDKLSTKAFISVGLVLGLTIVLSLINYYFALPFYTSIMNFPIDDFLGYILSIIIPFNVIKGIIYAIGQLLLLHIIVPFLQKKQVYYFA